MKLLLSLYALSVAIVVALCIYFLITEKKGNSKPWYWQVMLIIFAPVTLVVAIVSVIREMLKDPPRDWEKEQRELRKARCIEYGLPVGTRYLTFEDIWCGRGPLRGVWPQGACYWLHSRCLLLQDWSTMPSVSYLHG